LLYVGLCWCFWSVPVAAVPQHLLQPFGSIFKLEILALLVILIFMKVDNKRVSSYQFYSLELKYVFVFQLLNFNQNFRLKISCDHLKSSSVLVDQERVGGEHLGKQTL